MEAGARRGSWNHPGECRWGRGPPWRVGPWVSAYSVSQTSLLGPRSVRDERRPWKKPGNSPPCGPRGGAQRGSGACRTGQPSLDAGLYRLSQHPHILLNILFLCRLFEAGRVALERPDVPGRACLGGDSGWPCTRPCLLPSKLRPRRLLLMACTPHNDPDVGCRHPHLHGTPGLVVLPGVWSPHAELLGDTASPK